MRHIFYKIYWDSPVFANPSVSVHEKAELFDKIFEECLDRHAPIKKIKVHTNYKRGLTKETLKLIKERDQATEMVSEIYSFFV